MNDEHSAWDRLLEMLDEMFFAGFHLEASAVLLFALLFDYTIVRLFSRSIMIIMGY